MNLRLYLVASWVLLGSLCAVEPDQVARWNAARTNPKDSIRLDKAVWLYQRTEGRYESIANMRAGTIPAIVIFALHMREADNNFRTQLGQGDSLLHRSIHVPRGRIPLPAEPPFTWEQCAFDALFVMDHMDKHDWSTVQGALDACTGYNGWGPERLHHLPSGYVWAATSIYRGGKYVADGHWSSTASDGQIGCAAIFKRAQARGIALPFAPWPVATP